MINLRYVLLNGALLGSSHASRLDKRRGNGDGCTICVDNANNKVYGGCWNLCKTPRQEFSIPDCNISGKTTVCEYFKNDCGKVLGGCYPAEGPVPLSADPGCEDDLKRETIDDSETTCGWFTNACGKKFGGCYSVNGPAPVFADPDCA